MDSTEPPPPKVRRMNKHPPMHLSECVRQFKLPVHFPGLALGHKPIPKEHTLTPSKTVLKTIETEPQTIDVAKRISKGKNIQLIECPDKKIVHQISSETVLNGTNYVNKNLSPLSSNSILKSFRKLQPITMTNSLAKNYNGVSKIKTLKLKSPDGKDLGEFQVELLDVQNQPSKRKLITIPTSVLAAKDESHDDDVVSSTQTEPIVSYSIQDVRYPGAIYQEPRIDKVGQDLVSKVKIISNVSLNKLPADDLSKINQGKQMIQTIFSNTPFEPPTINTTKLNNSWINNNNFEDNSKKLLYLKPEDHPYLKNITKSGKPIALKPVKLKSLTLNLKSSGQPKENITETINNFTSTSGLSGYDNGDMDDCDVELPIMTSNNEENKSNATDKSDSKVEEKKLNTNEKKLPQDSESTDAVPVKREWKKLEYTLTKKNVMVMLPKIPAKKLITNRPSSESSFTMSDEDLNYPTSDVSNDQQEDSAKDKTSKNKPKKRKENPEESERNQAVDMSVVERALASVKDKTLREEALKILASCKLGIERQIPIRPASNEISVRDSTCQTNIFGNLDRNCEEFIEVSKKEKNLKRINKTIKDRSIAFQSLNYIASPIKKYEMENNYSSKLDQIIMDLDIDSNDKQEVKNIKNILERPIQSIEKINRVKEQIPKDINLLSFHDENGFTGLHRAVASDDTKTVKRLLMILPMTKNDVDVRTHDNRTSLELALKMDSDPEIVNLLLEAGAKPTSHEVGYDSALLIASKNSSPLLPELLKFATKPSLDSMDVEGYAAIHNCALRGNMTAVNALISAGANINLQDRRSGRTALFHAIENGHIEMARHLLTLGAKPSVRNNDGHTILPLLDEPKAQILKNTVLKAMKNH